MAIYEIVLIAIASLGLGLVAGYFFGKHGTKQARQAEELQQQLAANEKALADYKEEVMDHFQESAELVSNLTEAYRHVHNHIAEGASKLTTATLEGPILKNLPDKETLEAIMPAPMHAESISAPLDYAPKTGTSKPGMLDDAYGIEPVTDEVILAPDEVSKAS